MPIVPLEKTIMIDKMRLLKRTQWSLIYSLGKEENELISRAKLLGKQNRKAFTLLNLGKAILFVHRKSPSGEKQSR